MVSICSIARRINGLLRKKSSSEEYWIARYEKGGNSGDGSYGALATYKASILNEFINKYQVKSVIEYGCGDGNQLKLAIFPNYMGFDISPVAISLCKKIFQADKYKCFKLMNEYNGEKAELTLSLDVIYHLLEDEVFKSYLQRLFESSDRFVIIYSSDTNDQLMHQASHLKQRKFTDFIQENITGWKLISYIPNKYPYDADTGCGSISNFYIYEKIC